MKNKGAQAIYEDEYFREIEDAITLQKELPQITYQAESCNAHSFREYF